MVSMHNENVLTMDFIAYLQVLIAVSVLLQFLLDEVTIPDDIVREMVMQTIEEHHLPQLTGKCHCPPPSNLPIHPRTQYDIKRAEESVLSDWVGVAPQFPDRQFEQAFRMKRHMVDTILNHLCRRNTFWVKTVCRAGKETINPYVKFLCAMKMICYGVSGSAFIDYHQFGKTTSRRCVSKLSRGLLECRAFTEVYLCKPSKADA